MKIKIAIFASGGGTNAEEIIKYFQNHAHIEIALILSNNPSAYVLERAKNHGIQSFIFSREAFYNNTIVDEELLKAGIDFVVLAGFMWLMPVRIVRLFDHKMVNIHPALLPKYGGKGMYGRHVHEAVVKNGEKESGITIHWVNEAYDEGNVILQSKCKIDSSDHAEDVADKVHALEYAHFSRAIENVIMNKLN